MKKAYLPNIKKMPLSTILHALSDPARLKIIKTLLETKEACCGEFITDVSKSTMSHHFKVLREAGLLQKRDEGTKQFNCLRKDEIEARCPGLLEAIANAPKPF